MFHHIMTKKKLFFCASVFLIFCTPYSRATIQHNAARSTTQANNPSSYKKQFYRNSAQLYCFKRLEKAIMLIKIIHQKKIFHRICKATEKNDIIFNNTTIFNNEKIKICMQKITKTKSLRPFVQLCKTIEQKEGSVTNSFLKEFSIVILEIYKTIYTAYSPLMQESFKKNTLLSTIALLSENLVNLQTLELLSIVEKLTAQIPRLLEKYELTNSDISWRQWFSKYWWLPPVAIAATIILKRYLFTKHKKQTNVVENIAKPIEAYRI